MNHATILKVICQKNIEKLVGHEEPTFGEFLGSGVRDDCIKGSDIWRTKCSGENSYSGRPFGNPFLNFSLSADSFVSLLCSGRGRQPALFTQSRATDSRRSAAVFIWDAAVKVISQSSTLVI